MILVVDLVWKQWVFGSEVESLRGLNAERVGAYHAAGGMNMEKRNLPALTPLEGALGWVKVS